MHVNLTEKEHVGLKHILSRDSQATEIINFLLNMAEIA
jgi:hypothetical protein